MDTTRRSFLKTGAVAGASLALPPVAHAVAGQAGIVPDSLAVLSSELAPALTPPAAILPTRGIGLYPGAPSENFDPVVALDSAAPYRNLALLRPAFASSSYDYNLTPQLVTDGLVDTHLPTWITTVVSGQILPKHEREFLIDNYPEDVGEIPDPNPTVEFHLGGGVALPQVDRLVLFAVLPQSVDPASLKFSASISDDGHTWSPAGSSQGAPVVDPANYPPDLSRGNVLLAPSIPLNHSGRSRFYRVELGTVSDSAEPVAGNDERQIRVPWRLGQVEFHHGPDRVQLGGPYQFTSAWKSASLDEEWVFVDLGGTFSFDRIKLHWIARPTQGRVQVSDDSHTWHDLVALPAAGELDDLSLASPARGRYVRVLMSRPATEHGYILSELEVFGHGGFKAQPHLPAAADNGVLALSGGTWRLQRAPQVAALGEAISARAFNDSEWIVATVPGTVLTSYLNVGAIPDPNFGQNQLAISDSFFYSDFWYRTEFATPAREPDGLTFLTFEGINWKADVFLNGKKLGSIDGAFTRGRFEVSALLRRNESNALAVLIRKNRVPGSCKQKTYASTGKNGGGLGADNPTYHASIGWDWIPTIRGRNNGIWAEVLLTTTGAVTLEDPLVTSVLQTPDHSIAEVALEVIAVNHTGKTVSGNLRGRFGSVAFVQPVQLAANERKILKLTPATHGQLRISKPELWWPAGYGDPHLYDVDFRFEARGKTHHRLNFKAGIRQMTANEDGGVLRLFINGRRFIARGGNWGFGESMLRYRAREYDTAVRYHREQNFTMIRDWVGQIGDDAFYEACDRHGIVVWQDFWLANPWDGPVPEDNALFLANSRDYILRIRRHSSIGLYCGRNEGMPPAPLEAGLRSLLAELHPDMHYIGSSADGAVSGHGPYRTLSTPNYFRTADKKLHSEIGAPTIPPIESVRSMMPASALWPQGLDWGLHDFTLAGAQGGSALLTLIEEAYGGANSAEEWVSLAQFLNYDSYRAMFEAQSKYRMGLLLWMSHPCWPSFVWQTYDYYFEPTAAYFGCKKASEPIHIQWNSFTESIEIVNYNAGPQPALTAQVEILNMDGRSVSVQTFPLTIEEDSTRIVLKMSYPDGLSAVHYLRLTLSAAGAPDRKPLSTNFYLRGLKAGDFRAIRTLGQASVEHTTAKEQQGSRWLLTTTMRNTAAIPALMVRLKAVRASTRDRILPALYEDNYIALMPGEARVIKTSVERADARNELPEVELEGFNLAPPIPRLTT